MLEESLLNPDTAPADAALALLAFLRQEMPQGGAAAETRFLRLFGIIMDRIFGPLVLDSSSSSTEDFHEAISLYPHQGGGWMNREWARKNSPAKRSHTAEHRSRSLQAQLESVDVDPVVELLCGYSNPVSASVSNSSAFSSTAVGVKRFSEDVTAMSLLDVIEEYVKRKPNFYYRLPFRILPRATQLVFLSMASDSSLSPTSSASSNTIGIQASQQDPFRFSYGRGIPSSELTSNKLLKSLKRDNAERLLQHLLSVGYLEQSEVLQGLKKFAQQEVSQFVSQTSMNIPRQILPPTTTQASSIHPSFFQGRSPQHTSSFTSTVAQMPQVFTTNDPGNMNLTLTMLEYFLVSFIRYPLAAPPYGTQPPKKKQSLETSPTSNSRRSQYTSSKTISSTDYPVSSMDMYVRPHSTSQSCYGERLYLLCFKSYLKRYLKHGDYLRQSDDGTILDRYGELFLRLIIEFWLEGDTIYPTSRDTAEKLGTDNLGLEKSYDLAMLSLPRHLNHPFQHPWIQMNFQPPRTTVHDAFGLYPLPSQVQNCMVCLVQHVISDPALALSCTGQLAYTSSLSKSPVKAHKGVRFNVNVSNPSYDIKSWPLPQAQSIIQLPLYNYIRTVLRYAPIHDENSPFFFVLNLWLLWIEPWNVAHRKRVQHKDLLHTVSDRVAASFHLSNISVTFHTPKSTDPSKYTVAWETYVAANLHFYTVPLAIFLRRARELDFSTSDFNRSLNIVRKVFRVFSPDLVLVVNKFLDNQKVTPASLVVKTHEELLGSYSPRLSPRQLFSLHSCRQDMHNLLEEMFVQHQKSVREENFIDYILNFMGLVDKEHSIALEKIMLQAISIVNFPQGYEVLPSRLNLVQKESLDDKAIMSPERGDDLHLTSKGREQITSGSRICNPIDVVTLGDPMYSCVKSYEIPVLVKYSVKMSESINRRLGLDRTLDESSHSPTDHTSLSSIIEQTKRSREILFRFNFRFLADYRNVLFIFSVTLLIKLLG